MLRKAREKRTRKQVDLIVANDVSQSDRGFDVETNAVTIIGEDGEQEVPLQTQGRASPPSSSIASSAPLETRTAAAAHLMAPSNTTDQLRAHLEFFCIDGSLLAVARAWTPRATRHTGANGSAQPRRCRRPTGAPTGRSPRRTARTGNTRRTARPAARADRCNRDRPNLLNHRTR